MAMFNISADYQHPHKTYISVLLPSYLSLSLSLLSLHELSRAQPTVQDVAPLLVVPLESLQLQPPGGHLVSWL